MKFLNNVGYSDGLQTSNFRYEVTGSWLFVKRPNYLSSGRLMLSVTESQLVYLKMYKKKLYIVIYTVLTFLSGMQKGLSEFLSQNQNPHLILSLSVNFKVSVFFIISLLLFALDIMFIFSWYLSAFVCENLMTTRQYVIYGVLRNHRGDQRITFPFCFLSCLKWDEMLNQLKIVVSLKQAVAF